MTKFLPMLSPNQQLKPEELKYPLLASIKLDGVRIIFYKGKILTRSLKPVPNKQLNEKLEPIRKYTEENDIILDGEIYSHSISFQDIISYVMTDDFEDKKNIKKYGCVRAIPEDLKFYCFDAIVNGGFDTSFTDRLVWAEFVSELFENIVVFVEHKLVGNGRQVLQYFDTVLSEGHEGLMLRNPKGRYKCGRATLKENLIYKLKPYITFDAKIIGVVQATKVDPNAEKKVNELGNSVTSKKKGDRILIDKACDFTVLYEGKELNVMIAATDDEKKEIWLNRDAYIGRTIEYKALQIGMKQDGLPRHPTFIRFREDKND